MAIELLDHEPKFRRKGGGKLQKILQAFMDDEGIKLGNWYGLRSEDYDGKTMSMRSACKTFARNRGWTWETRKRDDGVDGLAFCFTAESNGKPAKRKK